jgi:Reverse transcriptase (RNA-dependent DNA polymerase)
VKEKHKLIIEKETHCLKLEKALYGLDQDSKQWWKNSKEIMKEIEYSQSPVDPCLFKKTLNGKLTFVIIYDDDLCFDPDFRPHRYLFICLCARASPTSSA